MKFNIQTKLLGSYLIIIAVMIGLGIFALYQLSIINDSALEIGADIVPSLTIVDDIHLSAARYRRQQLEHVIVTSAPEKDEFEAVMATEAANIDRLLVKYKPLVLNDEDRQAMDTAITKWETYLAQSAPFRAPSLVQNQEAAIKVLKKDAQTAWDQVGTALTNWKGVKQKLTDKAIEDAQAAYTTSQTLIIGIVIGAAVVAFVLGFWLAHSITKAIKTVARAAAGLAVGDLEQSVDIKSQDELGEMTEAFRQMITYQQQMAAAAGQLAQGDVSIQVTPKSDKDVLGDAFRQMVVNLRAMMDKTQILVSHLNNLPTPVLAVDREFSVTYMNPIGANWVGLTPEQCLGRKCYSLFKTPHCQSSECRLAQAMQQDGTFTGETVADPKGLNMPIRYTGAPIKNGNGQIIGALEYVIDITELRRLIDEANAQREYLSGEVNKLVAAMETLSQGDLNVSLSAQRQDEIARIVDAANTLIAYLQEMAGAANRMAQGDLTADITPQCDKDVLGNAFRQMIFNLRNLISQVADTANTVGVASAQLSTAAEQAGQATQQVTATIQQIAQGTTQQTQAVTEATNNVQQIARASEGIARGAQEQAQGITKTSELTVEMAAIVTQVGATARSVSEANTKVTQAAHLGVSAVGQTSQGMDAIRSRTLVAATKVKDMGNRSKEIGRIIETIDDIADKTDMLALNAAVEAARAGEYGRGFAVVADQVRKLSEDSKAATRDIGQLIERVQDTIHEAVAAMDSTVAEVDNGARLTGDTTRSLQEILVAAENAAALAGQIATAVNQLKQKSEGVVSAMETVTAVVEENTAVAEEMAASSQEVTQAMEGVAGVAEENSAAAEEVSAAAEEMSAQVEEVVASTQELSDLAEQLREAVAQFQVEESRPVQPQPGQRRMLQGSSTGGQYHHSLTSVRIRQSNGQK